MDFLRFLAATCVVVVVVPLCTSVPSPRCDGDCESDVCEDEEDYCEPDFETFLSALGLAPPAVLTLKRDTSCTAAVSLGARAS